MEQLKLNLLNKEEDPLRYFMLEYAEELNDSEITYTRRLIIDYIGEEYPLNPRDERIKDRIYTKMYKNGYAELLGDPIYARNKKQQIYRKVVEYYDWYNRECRKK